MMIILEKFACKRLKTDRSGDTKRTHNFPKIKSITTTNYFSNEIIKASKR